MHTGEKNAVKGKGEQGIGELSYQPGDSSGEYTAVTAERWEPVSLCKLTAERRHSLSLVNSWKDIWLTNILIFFSILPIKSLLQEPSQSTSEYWVLCTNTRLGTGGKAMNQVKLCFHGTYFLAEKH